MTKLTQNLYNRNLLQPPKSSLSPNGISKNQIIFKNECNNKTYIMIKSKSSSDFFLRPFWSASRTREGLDGNRFVVTSCRNECNGAQTSKRSARLHDGLSFLFCWTNMEGSKFPTVTVKCCSLTECGYHGNICSHTESMKRVSQGGTSLGQMSAWIKLK